MTVEMMCLTPLTPATASSIFLVTCTSSSDGAAPDCVIRTCTIGMSMLGKRVTGSVRKLTKPSTRQHHEDDERRHRAADRPGRDVEAHARPTLAVGRGRVGRRRAPGRPASGRRRRAPPLLRRLEPAARDLDPVALDDAKLDARSLDPAVLHDETVAPRRRRAARRSRARRGPRGATRSTSPEAKAPMRGGRVAQRDAHLASAARLVDLLGDQPHLAIDRLGDAGKLRATPACRWRSAPAIAPARRPRDRSRRRR